MPRTKGARNLEPSDQFRQDLLRLLRDKAHQGDLVAAGIILLLSEAREREGRHG